MKRYISILLIVVLLFSFFAVPVSASLTVAGVVAFLATYGPAIIVGLDIVARSFKSIKEGKEMVDAFAVENPDVVNNYYYSDGIDSSYPNGLSWNCVPESTGYLRMTYGYLSELCNDLQNLGFKARMYQLPRQSVEGWFQSDQRGWVIVLDDDQLTDWFYTYYRQVEVQEDGSVVITKDVVDPSVALALHGGHRHALTNNAGNILYAPFENNDTMISNDGRHYYTDNTHSETNNNTTNNYYQGGDTTTNNVYNHETNQIYDYANGRWVDVQELYYDASTKTYTANYQFNTGDTYYDYSMHWTYNIDYTSITYIGSSETYDIYNVYYELPDGRSSADLTAEDLEQLNLEYDVINYGQSCDDPSLRALYHFDGDTQDSSYWSSWSNFDWIKGASITYLEANAGFEGCLYLDETAHQFSVNLPSSLSYSDFSILFRYYQMESLNTDKPSLSIVAGESLCSLTYSSLPVGTWMEIALIRHDGLFCIYLNGVPFYGPVSNNKAYSDSIRFTFPEPVQAVRYFDELRVFNKAIVKDGADYTPIIQAQTTNDILVLPGEAKPIPDSYWNFNSDGNVFSAFDFTRGKVSVQNYGDYHGFVYGNVPLSLRYSSFVSAPVFLSEGMVLGAAPQGDIYGWSDEYEDPLILPGSGYSLPIYYETDDGSTRKYSLPGYSIGSDYTFSVMLSDGTVYSVPVSGYSDYVSDFSWGSIGSACVSGYLTTGEYQAISFLYIRPKTSVTVLYWELVPGFEPNEGHELVTAIYDPLDLDGPTIAIRSQIPVNLWKLGGVRPTIPERGDVWCGIQSSSIYTSQIYNGFAWVECEIRIWTDKERWVSAAYYNILTQQDFYDIQGTTDKEHLQTQQGFYTWFQTQWKQLLEILQTIDSRIEKLGTNSSSSVDLNFNIDGSIDVTFSKLADDGRKGILKVAFTFWELIFVDVWGSAGEALDNMAIVYGRDKTEFTIDGESGWTVWSIISPIKEDLWE